MVLDAGSDFQLRRTLFLIQMYLVKMHQARLGRKTIAKFSLARFPGLELNILSEKIRQSILEHVLDPSIIFSETKLVSFCGRWWQKNPRPAFLTSRFNASPIFLRDLTSL